MSFYPIDCSKGALVNGYVSNSGGKAITVADNLASDRTNVKYFNNNGSGAIEEESYQYNNAGQHKSVTVNTGSKQWVANEKSYNLQGQVTYETNRRYKADSCLPL